MSTKRYYIITRQDSREGERQLAYIQATPPLYLGSDRVREIGYLGVKGRFAFSAWGGEDSKARAEQIITRNWKFYQIPDNEIQKYIKSLVGFAGATNVDDIVYIVGIGKYDPMLATAVMELLGTPSKELALDLGIRKDTDTAEINGLSKLLYDEYTGEGITVRGGKAAIARHLHAAQQLL